MLYCGQSNFEFEYLGEFETEFENFLGYKSGAQVCSFDGKKRKSKISCYCPFKGFSHYLSTSVSTSVSLFLSPSLPPSLSLSIYIYIYCIFKYPFLSVAVSLSEYGSKSCFCFSVCHPLPLSFWLCLVVCLAPYLLLSLFLISDEMWQTSFPLQQTKNEIPYGTS
jgi:hypothetical protein